jgi:FHA domain
MSPASTYLRLEVISGVAPGSTLVVEDELIIGRHATGPGKLSEDEEISRRHARISREATGNYAIEDLGSSNGTFVNGLRIQSPRVLALGDSIETGATTLVVRAIVRPDPPPQAAAEVPQETSGSEAQHARTVFARSPVVQEKAAAGEPVPSPEAARPAEVAGPAELAGQTPSLALKLDVDFDAREARIALGDDGETVRMVLKDGAWRIAPGEA